MFFRTLEEAKSYARLEEIKTGRKHRVRKTRRYLNPLTTEDGPLYLSGYTVVLAR